MARRGQKIYISAYPDIRWMMSNYYCTYIGVISTSLKNNNNHIPSVPSHLHHDPQTIPIVMVVKMLFDLFFIVGTKTINYKKYIAL